MIKKLKIKLFLLSCMILLLIGCTTNTPVEVKPVLPAKVAKVKVNFTVVSQVTSIDGKEYLVTPYKGQPLVAMTYADSLMLRSFLDDVKRQKDQYEVILCHYGYTTLCSNKKPKR